MISLILLLAAIDVAGEVRSAVTHEPLSGVSVQVVGTRIGTLTDSAGHFSVAVDAGGRLRFSRIGFGAAERVIADSTRIVVELVPAANLLENVTVRAIRGGGNAPIAATELSRPQIEQSYFGQDMPVLLAATPSIIWYGDAGNYSNYTYARLRGIDETRINITLDGVPLNDPEDQFVYFADFPDLTNSIQSVQVQRGVGTSTNGTASYAGSVNFETTSLTGTPRAASLEGTFGSFGTRRGSAAYASGLLSNRLAFSARYSEQYTNGYRYHSGNHANSGFFSGGYFGDRNIFKVTAFAGLTHNQEAYSAASSDEISQDPRTNPLSDRERDRFYETVGAATYTRLLSDKSSLSATLYNIRTGGAYGVLYADTLYDYNLYSSTVGAMTTWSRQSARLALDAGAHANSYWRDHYEFAEPNLSTPQYFNTGHKSEASAFTKASMFVGRMTLYGDLQFRTAEFRYSPDAQSGIAGASVRWNFINPKAGVSYRLSAPLSIYASYGRTSREPARNDMFAGADNIDATNAATLYPLDRVHPEEVNDFEAGANWRAGSVALQSNVFDMEFHNEITPIGPLSELGLPLRKNVSRSYRRGVELDATYRGIPRLLATVSATASHNRIAEFTDDATGKSYRDVPPILTPDLLVSPALELRAARALRLGVRGRYVSRSFLSNTGDDAFTTPAYFLLDGSAAWQLGRAELLVQGNNLTNARIFTSGYTDGSSSYYYVMAERNVFVTVRLSF